MRHSSSAAVLAILVASALVLASPGAGSNHSSLVVAQDPPPSTGNGSDRPNQPGDPPLGSEDSALSKLDREITALAERARRSVVKISALTRLPLPHPDVIEDGQPTEFVIPVTYSGLIVRSDGFIVTVADAVERATEFQVSLPDGRERKATVWASDVQSNLAVLHIEADLKPGDLTPARLDGTAALRPGQFMLTCGNPFGLTRTISTGVVTGVERTIVIDGQPFFGVIQTNSNINPGDPGGAALSADGSFVGMIWSTYGRSSFGQADPRRNSNSRKDAEMLRDALRRLFGVGGSDNGNGEDSAPFDSAEMERYWKQRMNEYYRELAKQQEQQVYLSAQGINFVLPAALIRHVSNELIEHKRVARGSLGIRIEQRMSAEGRMILIVTQVMPESPALAAGIQVGDLLVGVNHQEVMSMADVQRLMQTARAGQDMHVRVVRQGGPVDADVKLMERPEPPRSHAPGSGD
ncbi:MAG: S1C family serine protease [Planctomycetota bacterium]